MNFIRVADVIGGSFGASAMDGQKIYDLIKASVKKRQYIEVSFAGMELTKMEFLNYAFGQLWRDFTFDVTFKYVSIVDATKEIMTQLSRINTDSIQFHATN